MRTALAVTCLLLLTCAAHAQGRGPGTGRNPDIAKEAMEREKKRAEVEKEYDAMIKNIPEQKRSASDPWAGVREAEPAKPHKKPK